MNDFGYKLCNNIKKHKKIYFFLCAIIVLVAIDQIIKVIVQQNLQVYDSLDFIPYLLRVTYLQNYGAAFNFMSGHKIFLIIFTLAVIAFLIGFVVKNKLQDIMYLIPITMIVSGGFGNLLDRLIRGYVIDYIDTIFWPMQNFSIFNFADCLVVVGSIILLIKLIKDEIVNKKEQKNNKENENAKN